MFKLFKTPHTRTNQTRKNTTRPSDVVCCDQTYAKSKQGIFKLVMLLGSFLAWMCCATTPYVKVKILKFYHFLQFSATFSQFFWFFFQLFLLFEENLPDRGCHMAISYGDVFHCDCQSCTDHRLRNFYVWIPQTSKAEALANLWGC